MTDVLTMSQHLPGFEPRIYCMLSELGSILVFTILEIAVPEGKQIKILEKRFIYLTCRSGADRVARLFKFGA